jgi:hypothetical protein
MVLGAIEGSLPSEDAFASVDLVQSVVRGMLRDVPTVDAYEKLTKSIQATTGVPYSLISLPQNHRILQTEGNTDFAVPEKLAEKLLSLQLGEGVKHRSAKKLHVLAGFNHASISEDEETITISTEKKKEVIKKSAKSEFSLTPAVISSLGKMGVAPDRIQETIEKYPDTLFMWVRKLKLHVLAEDDAE